MADATVTGVALIEGRSAWQLAADAIERAARLVAEVPGFDGYPLAPETDLDLRAAAVLMQRAVSYLHAAAVREAPRLEALEARFEARGELAPWDRRGRQLTEEGD